MAGGSAGSGYLPEPLLVGTRRLPALTANIGILTAIMAVLLLVAHCAFSALGRVG